MKKNENDYAERMRIGRRIAELREEMGMTQETLASRSDLARHNVAAVEKGLYAATSDVLGRIAKALGRELDFIKR